MLVKGQARGGSSYTLDLVELKSGLKKTEKFIFGSMVEGKTIDQEPSTHNLWNRIHRVIIIILYSCGIGFKDISIHVCR